MKQVDCLVCGTAERQPLLTLRPDDHRRIHPQTAKERVRFVICKGCGFIYQTPRFTLDELKPIYMEEYRKDTMEADGVPKAQYLEFARTKSRMEFEWIRERLTFSEGSRVLEVGCSTGQLLRYFKDEGWMTLGVEPTRSFAEYGSRTHGLPILPMLFEEAHLEPGFDLVILSQVLEHVQEPAKLLLRTASLLGPTGRLYVTVPYYVTYLPIRPARELFISTHFYAFSPISLANIASRCGLVVEAEGTMSRYLCVIFRHNKDNDRSMNREDPANVRRRVRMLALQYFVLHDFWYLLSERTKHLILNLLGEKKGEHAIESLRRFKHRLTMREHL